jgi:hypothetical protein
LKEELLFSASLGKYLTRTALSTRGKAVFEAFLQADQELLNDLVEELNPLELSHIRANVGRVEALNPKINLDDLSQILIDGVENLL